MNTNKRDEAAKLLSDLLAELETLLTKGHQVKEQIQNLLQENNEHTKRTAFYLHVKLSDGTTICRPRGSDTFVEAIEYLGTEKVYHAAVAQNILRRDYPVVDKGHHDESAWRRSGDYGIYVGGNTKDKAKDLEKIKSYLGSTIEVKVLNEEEYLREVPSLLSNDNKLRG